MDSHPCGASPRTELGRDHNAGTLYSLSRRHPALGTPDRDWRSKLFDATPEMLRVTRTADDGGEGSLRWAIERNNAAPGHFRIELAPAGQAPYVIKLASPLPALKGPVAIEGAPWKRSGEFVAL